MKFKNLILLSLITLGVTPVSAQEIYRININRVCADMVGIPYASDNFSDKEWEQFKVCLNVMKEYQE
jgi:hypothetical protein